MAREREGSRRQLGSPLGLLASGYATAGLVASAVALIGGGLAAVFLIFWLGGALATLSWAVAWASLSAAGRSKGRHNDRYASHPTPTTAR